MTSSLSYDDVTRRPATPADLDLIYSILRTTLSPYVEQTFGPWDDHAQRQRFNEVTNPDHHTILEINHQPVGCLCLTTSTTEIRLIRLFILPEFQNRGLGTRILQEITATADTRHLPIRLRVLKVNPARRLYERHNFAVTEESESHYTLIRPHNPTWQTQRESDRTSGLVRV